MRVLERKSRWAGGIWLAGTPTAFVRRNSTPSSPSGTDGILAGRGRNCRCSCSTRSSACRTQPPATLWKRARAALRTLGLPEPGKGDLEVPVHVPEPDYRWEHDPELGWVFTSDKYCCYSLRNRPHAGSDEGQFPFIAFREMMSDVERQLNEH